QMDDGVRLLSTRSHRPEQPPPALRRGGPAPSGERALLVGAAVGDRGAQATCASLSGLMTLKTSVMWPSTMCRLSTPATDPSAARATAPGWPLTSVGSSVMPRFVVWR